MFRTGLRLEPMIAPLATVTTRSTWSFRYHLLELSAWSLGQRLPCLVQAARRLSINGTYMPTADMLIAAS